MSMFASESDSGTGSGSYSGSGSGSYSGSGSSSSYSGSGSGSEFVSGSGSGSGRGSKSSQAIKGEEWKGCVYFDRNVNEEQSYQAELTADVLMREMRKLVFDEKILSVFEFKVPLHSWQWTNKLMYHSFVVFKTDFWWWSIEKNSENITLQRSRMEHSVLLQYRKRIRETGWWIVPQYLRGRFKHTKEDTIKLMDVLQYIFEKKELSKKYNAFSENCQIFSGRMFDLISSALNNEEDWNSYKMAMARVHMSQK